MYVMCTYYIYNDMYTIFIRYLYNCNTLFYCCANPNRLTVTTCLFKNKNRIEKCVARKIHRHNTCVNENRTEFITEHIGKGSVINIANIVR